MRLLAYLCWVANLPPRRRHGSADLSRLELITSQHCSCVQHCFSGVWTDFELNLNFSDLDCCRRLSLLASSPTLAMSLMAAKTALAAFCFRRLRPSVLGICGLLFSATFYSWRRPLFIGGPSLAAAPLRWRALFGGGPSLSAAPLCRRPLFFTVCRSSGVS